ncbi:MBL fold metallo-hydrolase [Streptomyces sp. A7024]|uniref:gluconokinase n=2 Tax=Streptomyces coryli TaxID=1128680 RepID=A0A6G4U5R6_9ACTN|nr:MBL fold metallo-hydrolase [Streptomyces coryli]
MAAHAPLVVVMGVTGSGKSTVGEALSERIGLPFAEGDDFHPPSNIEKMSGGTPLNDDDRLPWLDAIASWLAGRTASGGIISCSALKRRYRDRLAGAVDGLFFLHLDGSPELIGERLEERRDHFMPKGLLRSQFDALEPLTADENGATISVAGPPEGVVQRSLDAIRAPYPLQLAPGVHAYVQPDGGWCLSNAGFVSDGTTTLLVDTAATESRALKLRDTVLASGAPQPTMVVNTHHHGDHTYGNSVFAPAAAVIGHRNCRAEVAANGKQLHLLWPDNDFGEITVNPPNLTYDDTLTLHVGDTEVQLIHPGVAHTTGDTIVWLPQQRVVFTGDLAFHGGSPFIPMGSLTGSLAALDLLRSLGARTVVAGHGSVTDPGVFDATERYLRFVADLAQEGYAAGRTPLEVARTADLGEFAALREPERLAPNLHRAYAELQGRPPGVPLDPLQVFGDMAELNGGTMPTCHA